MAELNKAKISQRLQASRKDAGLTQQQMADLLHVHKRSVEDYESARNGTVPFDRISEWATLTGTSSEWLLHGIEAASGRGGAGEAGDLGEVLSRLEDIGEALDALQKTQTAILRRLPVQKATQPKTAAGASKRRR
jgi:transcriptional regulator with XRE-family HTH domain